jgi:hypothetical protein
MADRGDSASKYFAPGAGLKAWGVFPILLRRLRAPHPRIRDSDPHKVSRVDP